MSAALALQAAVVAALAAADGVAGVASGVYDGPPARARLPYLALGEGTSFDWSHKTGRGREHRLAVLAWDEAGRSARLQALLAAAGLAIEALPRDLPGSGDLPGHRIASIVFVRERIVRDPVGPLMGLSEYRVRTLEA